jgi:N6-adenosine-specific RNA methylase IME4
VSKYKTIVADPPWPMPDSGPRTAVNGNWVGYVGGRSMIPYPTMSLEAIAALPVKELLERDAHLYIWTTNRFLEATYDIARGWGAEPSTLLTWFKAPMGLGMGGAYALTTEHVLFCRRGSLKAQSRVDSTWFQWKRGKHSAKPEGFLDIVEAVSPGPYLEMFARRNRLGWDTWGNQSFEHVEMGALG